MPVRRITPALFIRQHVLAMTNGEFAAALNVNKAVVSRYEITGIIPVHHHAVIRKLAAARKVKIRPEWFQAVPWAPGVPA